MTENSGASTGYRLNHKKAVLLVVAATIMVFIGFLAFEMWQHRGGRIHGESDEDFQKRERMGS